MSYLTIDRFEGGYAVCEDEGGRYVNIAGTDIEDLAKEGDIIFRQSDSGKYTVDRERTDLRREAIVAKFRRLRRDS